MPPSAEPSTTSPVAALPDPSAPASEESPPPEALIGDSEVPQAARSRSRNGAASVVVFMGL
jgi:hypothetical protein